MFSGFMNESYTPSRAQIIETKKAKLRAASKTALIDSNVAATDSTVVLDTSFSETTDSSSSPESSGSSYMLFIIFFVLLVIAALSYYYVSSWNTVSKRNNKV